MRGRVLYWLLGAVAASASIPRTTAETIHRRAADTLTAVELEEGDTLNFTLANGQTRTLTIEETNARVLLTNLPRLKQGFHGGATLYEMTCRVRIDGHPLTMRRFAPVQQSLYEPYVINGLRIFFDGVRKIEEFLNDNHGGGLPRKAARFAVQDMTLPLCPQELRPWYPNSANYIDVAQSYNADDVWMGPYQGADLHGGLDINMPIGTPLWAPIDFDNQYYFNSLKAGDNNNRWRGVRTWPNGQRWVLQAHHIVRLRIPEETPLKQGTDYAEAAGVLTGSHAHSHFVFKVGPEQDETLLDAWILFWEIFENNKRRAGHIASRMKPLSPARCGHPVNFSSAPSRAGVTGNGLRYRWTFGDGGTSVEAEPEYAFTQPGLYPVTLFVDDGAAQAQFTQHITVDGESQSQRAALVLHAPQAPSFRKRLAEEMDIYGWDVPGEPCVLTFLARPRSAPRPTAQTVVCVNAGGGDLATKQTSVQYRDGRDWLRLTSEGDELRVAVDASRLPDRHGIYRADVSVDCPGAINSPQTFGVQLTVPPPQTKPLSEVTVDNEDSECQYSPALWLSPQFHRHVPDKWRPGHRGGYLFYGGSPDSEGVVRFTPDLLAGTYRVKLAEETPFPPTAQTSETSRFQVRVRHKAGTEVVWVEPRKSREIGEFAFDQGKDGYVEILTSGAHGPVIADAVRFQRQGK